jgi:preprotein translocase subunit SecD
MVKSLYWRTGVAVLVIAWSLFMVYPSIGPVPAFWAKYFPSSPVRLGLDLQGGLHLMLEVDTEKAVETAVDQAMADAASLMKDAKIRYSDVERISSFSFAVYLKEAGQAQLFKETVLGKVGAFKELSATEGPKGFEINLGLDPKIIEETKKHAVRQAVDTIRNRVDALGVTEPDVVLHGEDRIIVQLPGLKEDVDQAVRVIKQTARLEFKIVDEKGDLNAALKGKVPPGDEILYKIDRNARTGAINKEPFLVKKQVLMTGDVLTDAKVRPDRGGRMYIAMDFNRRGGQLFERLTGEHVQERLAIILDDRVFSAPVIKDRIAGGSAVIEGMFTPEEAHELALVLRSGSLPAPVKILETRSIGPSLGEDSIRTGRNALIFGIVLVMIAMAVYYQWSGMVANVALILNLPLVLAVMVSPGLRATLTLPGLAGIALTMGMAVDANVLIFERIREELRSGKSPANALEAGYTRAFATIFDSNLTTILAALPLIQFGTGPIKGFAVTLCIGLTISLFTALFVSRIIFDWAFEKMEVKRFSV